jgi:cytochrome c-type biogenesis protein CcmH/NrfF
MNEQQIVNDFVVKYGKVILPAPPAEGFDLVAWTLPFFALLTGFIFIYVLIRTWLHRNVSVASRTGSSESIPEAYQKQIDRELKNLDL